MQGLFLYVSSPPSTDKVETIDICHNIQNQDTSDASLEACLEAEEMKNDDEEATVGSSQ